MIRRNTEAVFARPSLVWATTWIAKSATVFPWTLQVYSSYLTFVFENSSVTENLDEIIVEPILCRG